MDKNTHLNRTYNINCKGKLIDLSTPKIMGILNVSDDSFYDGGQFSSLSQQLYHVEKLLNEGADFIDIGAMTTKPGSLPIDEQTEIKRITQSLNIIQKQFPGTMISIDTYRASVAKIAYDHGASLINDISGGLLDNVMFSTLSNMNIPYILGHIQGSPFNMQNNPTYTDICKELITYFANQINRLHKLGIKDIIIDPCLGFGKTTEHNFELLNNLTSFSILEKPILIGLSRKSLVWKKLNISPYQALNGSTCLNTLAILKKASILRVHDVAEAKQIVSLLD